MRGRSEWFGENILVGQIGTHTGLRDGAYHQYSGSLIKDQSAPSSFHPSISCSQWFSMGLGRHQSWELPFQGVRACVQPGYVKKKTQPLGWERFSTPAVYVREIKQDWSFIFHFLALICCVSSHASHFKTSFLEMPPKFRMLGLLWIQTPKQLPEVNAT